MRDIIIGCGQLGSGLAKKMYEKGHSLVVIDTSSDSFKLLGEGFHGKLIAGVGFDRDVLAEAEIEMADAVVACTSSDEANALIGRIAKNIYKVPCVVARMNDERKAKTYHSLGIQTISTTNWGIHKISEILSYSKLDSLLTIGDSHVEMVRIEIPELLIGRTINELVKAGEVHVVAVSRNNITFLPTMGTVLQKHDVVYIAVLTESASRLKSLLGFD